MNYPVWLVDGIGPGWVIGIIATIHVLVSHFAVGGGLFLPITEYWARKNNRNDVIDVLKRFSKFFLILTNVLGAITGVGIWFAIMLVSPDSTSNLIRLFGFIWAVEWAVFFVEISSLIFYYYGWDRMKPETHQKVGWIYAITAWLSLFTINGILTFMLTPGAWESTAPYETFWAGYFNPGFMPSLILRTLLCIALAGVYATFTISKLPESKPLRKELLSYASTWLLPIYVLLGGVLFWYFAVGDESVRENLLSGITGGVGQAGFGNMAIVARTLLVATIALIVSGIGIFLTAYLNPNEFTWRKSALLLAVISVFVVCFEYSREMLRKPYTIRGYLFSNGIMRSQAQAKDIHESFTDKMRFKPDGSETGQQMFVGQCMACHTVDGYRSLKDRLGERDEESIYQFLLTMQKEGEENPYHKVMPPLLGTDEEVRALAKYLHQAIQGDEELPAATEEPPVKLQSSLPSSGNKSAALVQIN